MAGGLGPGQRVVVAQRLVDRLVMDGSGVVNRCANALIFQMILECLTVTWDADGVLVKDVPPAGTGGGQLDAPQALVHVAGIGHALLVPGGQFFELGQADGCLEVGGAKVIAEDIVPVAL